jgi:hypothetical protein
VRSGAKNGDEEEEKERKNGGEALFGLNNLRANKSCSRKVFKVRKRVT